MNRLFFGFTRNVNFLLERELLTARIPMPVEGRWDIKAVTRCESSGDMIVAFRQQPPPSPVPNPLVEAEVSRLGPPGADSLNLPTGHPRVLYRQN